MGKIGWVIVLIALGAVAWYFLLRPSDITQEKMTADYENHKAAFVTVATYLSDNNISAEIDDIIMVGKDVDVPNVDETDYREFNEAVEELMDTPYHKIISDGETVTFVYTDKGGYLNRIYGVVIYNKKDDVGDKKTVKLENRCWYLYLVAEKDK